MNKLYLLVLCSLVISCQSIPTQDNYWPEGVQGGIEVANSHCSKPDTDSRETIVFEYPEGNMTVFLSITCKELLEKLDELNYD